MKKGTKIALWASIPLVLAIWFVGPRIGLWGDRDLKKGAEVPSVATQGQGQGQAGGKGQGAGGQQGAGHPGEILVMSSVTIHHFLHKS